jgi:ketosteroid isomerase-like protein
MSTARDIQLSAWDAESRRDLDELLTYFAPDAVFQGAGQPARRGHDEIRALTQDFYDAYTSLDVDLVREWGDGKTAAGFEFVAHVEDGHRRRFTIEGIVLVTIEDGRFTSVRYYEDQPREVTAAA